MCTPYGQRDCMNRGPRWVNLQGPIEAIKLEARRTAFHGGVSLAGECHRVFRPILHGVRPKRFTSNDDLHVQRSGAGFDEKPGVTLTVRVLVAHRAWVRGGGAVGSDVLPGHWISIFVHDEHVDQDLAPACVDALVFGRLPSLFRVTGHDVCHSIHCKPHRCPRVVLTSMASAAKGRERSLERTADRTVATTLFADSMWGFCTRGDTSRWCGGRGPDRRPVTVERSWSHSADGEDLPSRSSCAGAA